MSNNKTHFPGTRASYEVRMERNTAFLFVPGAWHLPAFFDGIRARLAQDGYESIACALPSVTSHSSVTSMAPDVATVYQAVESILEEGKQLVCVAHSYGGTVLTEAIGILASSKRESSKSIKNIKRLIYVSAMVPQLGERQIDVARDAHVDVTPPVYYRWEKAVAYVESNVANVFYNDEPPEVRAKLAATLSPQAIASVTTPVTVCGWRFVPSTYVFTSQDVAIPITKQRFIVDTIRHAAGPHDVQPFDLPLGEATIDCGHCAPFVSRIDEMLQILLQCAEKT